MGNQSTEKRIAFAGPWIGEFGWEIMTWVPYLRKLSHDYDKMYISTFRGVEALYTGFHCELEFLSSTFQHGRVDNWLDYQGDDSFTNPLAYCAGTDHIKPIKEYSVEGEYVRYGSPVIKDAPILFNARGIERGAFKNWAGEKWMELSEEFPSGKFIGSVDDLVIIREDPLVDYRGFKLQALMDLIASASIVIGQSSGVMHLALMCGTPICVWGDDTLMNFGESLETRYKETWNPFGTPVTWVSCEKPWDPEPEQILNALKPKDVPDMGILGAINAAVRSGRYIVAIAHVGEKDGNEAVFSTCIGVDFPDNELLEQAEAQLCDSVKRSVSNAKTERRPVSWA